MKIQKATLAFSTDQDLHHLNLSLHSSSRDFSRPHAVYFLFPFSALPSPQRARIVS